MYVFLPVTWCQMHDPAVFMADMEDVSFLNKKKTKYQHSAASQKNAATVQNTCPHFKISDLYR
jgi:hypothetical protein